MTLIAATILLSFLKISPAFFKIFNRLDKHPKFKSFLDYFICLVTGEVIYSVAFGHLEKQVSKNTCFILILVTLVIGVYIMHKTEKISLSLIIALTFAILSYFIFLV